jgi:hypothetical protein
MVEGAYHQCGYDIYGLGLLLLEMRTAQPPFVHLMRLPWEQQRLRRTFRELADCGTIGDLLPSEQQLLQRCLQPADMRVNADELVKGGAYFRERPM